jgi:aryl-alcohol dehydrogenase-like predicted oxidoreductase
MGDTSERQMEQQVVHLAPAYETPRLIVGAWQFSAGHNVDPANTEDALNTLTAFAESGLSTFDCADIYTGVEELLGEFLRRAKRNKRGQATTFQVHTKFVPDRDALPHISKAYTERIIDRSLRRLGVEQLDLVQFSWWDYDVPGYVETAQWLNELRQAGKIRHLGVTNFDVRTIREIVDAGIPVVSQQVQYSALDHRPEHGLVEFCHEHDIHLLCYGTVAGGFLSDRWLGAPEPTGSLANRSLTKYKLMIDEFGGWEAFQELLLTLHDVAAKHGVGISEVATQYVLERPRVAAAIVGARSTEHLEHNLRVLTLKLDDQDIERIRGLAVDCSAGGDVFELEREPHGKHASIMRYNLNTEGTSDVDDSE